jgi:hypothetical protein
VSTKSDYEAYKRLYDRLIKLFRPRVERALRAQVRVFTDAMQVTKGITPAIIPPQIIEKSLKELHITAGVNGAKLTAKQVKRSVKGVTDDEARWQYVIEQYLKRYDLTQVSVEITNTLREQITAQLKKAEELGWSIEKTVSSLNRAAFPKWMATRIVRTETNKAANTGSMVAATDTGIAMDKKWISTQDNRTRRIPRDQYDHLDMNGRIVGMNERFVVPSTKSVDAMLYPGDPAASVGNLVNCRCCVVFVPHRDGEGEPVVRQPEPSKNVFEQLLQEAEAIGLHGSLSSVFAK